MQEPSVSVVVIGRNEGKRLERCLASVRRMNYSQERTEIIYVDSSSTDHSVELAKGAGAVVITLDLTRPSAARARNAGWRASAGAFVLFLDGDTILHPDFVKRSLPIFDASDVAAVWGHRREIVPEQSIYTRVLDLDWIWPPGDSRYCGGDALMRKSALSKVDGFDDDLIAGEEPELCRRFRALNYRIVHCDFHMTGHDLGVTKWTQYWRRAVRTGYAYAEIAWRFHDSQDPLWSEERDRNLVQALAYVLVALTGIVASLNLRSIIPAFVASSIFAALAVRTALRNRRLGAPFWLRLLHGVHSHLQQIPIALGQLEFWRHRFLRRNSPLIEYRHEG